MVFADDVGNSFLVRYQFVDSRLSELLAAELKAAELEAAQESNW